LTDEIEQGGAESADSLDDVRVETSPAERDELTTRFEAQIAFDGLVEQERHAEALVVGQRLVELTGAEFGDRSLEKASSLARLADAQREAGAHGAAEQSYLEAIEIFREADGVFSPTVVAPLVGLGASYHDAGNYLNALTVFSEARSVNRRVAGLLNEQQIPILDWMTETLYSMNRVADADEHQLEALQIVERNHGNSSPEILDALYKNAFWLRRNGRYNEERDMYVRAMDIVRAHDGRESVAMVKPLRETGNSFRMQRIGEGQGLSALTRALTILEGQTPPDPLALAEVLRDIGDWHVAFSKVGADGAEYRRAWQLLGEVADGATLRRRWFSGPEYVLREPVSQRGLSDDPEALSGYVLVQFDLDEAGRTSNVRVLRSEPVGLKDEAVTRSIARSRFRPQMQDGEIVRGDGLALQFTYRYSPDEQAD
jgi:TonB family protein